MPSGSMNYLISLTEYLVDYKYLPHPWKMLPQGVI